VPKEETSAKKQPFPNNQGFPIQETGGKQEICHQQNESKPLSESTKLIKGNTENSSSFAMLSASPDNRRADSAVV
jgi:hypothetical protein